MSSPEEWKGPGGQIILGIAGAGLGVLSLLAAKGPIGLASATAEIMFSSDDIGGGINNAVTKNQSGDAFVQGEIAPSFRLMYDFAILASAGSSGFQSGKSILKGDLPAVNTVSVGLDAIKGFSSSADLLKVGQTLIKGTNIRSKAHGTSDK